MSDHLSFFLERLKEMRSPELKATYIEVFGEKPHSHRVGWLRNRIAWGYQAKLETGMSKRFMDFARKNADLSELRARAPQTVKRPSKPAQETLEQRTSSKKINNRDPRIPKPGSVLQRTFKGQEIAIKVLEEGFEWNGTVFKSFSKAVKTATGSSYSPFTFFKLGAKA